MPEAQKPKEQEKVALSPSQAILKGISLDHPGHRYLQPKIAEVADVEEGIRILTDAKFVMTKELVEKIKKECEK